MAKEIDDKNVELENYGTWVRKDLKDVETVSESVSVDEDSLDDLNFDDVGDAEDYDEPFSLDEDEMDEDFDLPDLDDLGDDLISPEEENELISMAEDSWTPHEEDDATIQPLDDEELENSLFLDQEDIEAAGDFMPEHDLDGTKPVVETPPALPDTAMSLVEKQTELLSKIEKELSVIKDEILDIRKQMNVTPTSAVQAPEKTEDSGGGGFFEEDDDESIVLTGDELDNIFNTAEMTVEEGEETEIQAEDPGLSMLSEADGEYVGNEDRSEDEFALDDQGLMVNESELSLDTEELSLDTEELSLDTEELSLDTEELSLDTEELSLDTEELSLDTEELSLDTEELSLDTEELSLDTEELSLDTEELSLDTEELSLDTEELSLDTEELSLDTEELSLDTEELSLDTEELSLDTEELSLDDEELSLDDEELSLDDEELSLDDEELSLDDEELSLDNEELSLDNEELSLDNEELSLDNEELSLDNEELSLDNEELSLDNEELSLDNEELSLDNEELSLDNEELSLDNEELSLDNEELSLGSEELSLDQEPEESIIDSMDLNLDEDGISPDPEDRALEEEGLSFDEELSDASEQEPVNTGDLELEDEELILDSIEILEESGTVSPDEGIDEIQDVQLDEFSIDLDAPVDDGELVLDLTGTPSSEENMDEFIEDVSLDEFGFENEEPADSGIEGIEDVSLDDLEEVSLDDLGTETSRTDSEAEDEEFDFNLTLSDENGNTFDEGEIVDLDELERESADIEGSGDGEESDHLDDMSIDEDLTLVEDVSEEEKPLDAAEESGEETEETHTINLADMDREGADDVVDLDNSDLPEIDSFDDLQIDDAIPNITESDDEITLDISDFAQLSENDELEDLDMALDDIEISDDLTLDQSSDDSNETEPKEDLSLSDEISIDDMLDEVESSLDQDLPGTEEIDLNSLEALAIPSEENAVDEGVADLEDSIEIDLDDVPEDLINQDMSVDDSEDADEEVISIDLPHDFRESEDLLAAAGPQESIEEMVIDADSLEDDLGLDDIDVEEVPEEFVFNNEIEEATELVEEEKKPLADEPETAALEELHSDASHEQRPPAEPGMPGQSKFAEAVSSESLNNLPPSLRKEIREILTYMDQLLESLPEEKIQEFAHSEHFEVYKKIFEELGITS